MTRKDAVKLFARFLAIFGLCCPIFVIIGVTLEDNVNGVLETTIYIVIAGLLFILEEYFFWKGFKKRAIAKSQTTPEAYFKMIKANIAKKQHLVEETEKSQPKRIEKSTENSVQKINIKKGKKKNVK